jgi:AbrB family looped-hinge helix DNA binding protein
MRISSKGQVTIPADIRERAGLLPDTEVEFLYDGENVRLVRAGGSKKQSRGAKIVEHLRRHAGRAAVNMTTDEIMALTRGEE